MGGGVQSQQKEALHAKQKTFAKYLNEMLESQAKLTSFEESHSKSFYGRGSVILRNAEFKQVAKGGSMVEESSTVTQLPDLDSRNGNKRQVFGSGESQLKHTTMLEEGLPNNKGSLHATTICGFGSQALGSSSGFGAAASGSQKRAGEKSEFTQKLEQS